MAYMKSLFRVILLELVFDRLPNVGGPVPPHSPYCQVQLADLVGPPSIDTPTLEDSKVPVKSPTRQQRFLSQVLTHGPLAWAPAFFKGI